MGSVKAIVLSACSVVMFGALSAQAASPIVQYNFPASWNGTGTVVTDLSGAGNNGHFSTTVAKDPTISTTLPPGATAGTDSLVTSAGGVITTNLKLLTNPTIAAAGGFQYDLDFLWNGATNSAGIEKLIDYAGTDALQLDTINTTAGTANADFIFTTMGVSPAPDTTVGPSTPILANTWYEATATFSTSNPVAGDGTLAGLATLTVTPIGGSPTTASLGVTKTTYGDGLNRPIGFGELGFSSTSSALVLFQGNIYNPSVSLLPEPASLAMLGLAALPMIRRRRA